MKKLFVLFALAVLVAVPALAQNKDVTQIGVRLGPPNFGAQVTGDFCTNPGTAIPDTPSPGITSNLVVAGGGVINNDFELGLEITHTWVGDLQARITHVDTATTVIAMDRPGQPATAFGCSGDDIDVILSALGSSPVETTCAAAVPTISGVRTPNNPFTAFNGQSFNGTWTLALQDFAAGDVGTLDVWCVNGPTGTTTGGTTTAGGVTGGATTAGGVTGGTGTPATTTWGVALLIALFLGVSMFYLRRRGASHA